MMCKERIIFQSREDSVLGRGKTDMRILALTNTVNFLLEYHQVSNYNCLLEAIKFSSKNSRKLQNIFKWSVIYTTHAAKYYDIPFTTK